MKKYLLKVALLCAALFLMLAGMVGCSDVHVPDTETDDAFTISHYDVTMNVAADRVIGVTERITVRFNRRRSGIIRDFDLTGGVRYQDLSARRDGEPLPVSTQYDTGEMLSFYLGDEGVYLEPSKPYLYEIAYTMTVPALSDRNYLPLDVLGFDWYTNVERFTATLTLPAAPKSYQIFSGRYDTTSDNEGVAVKTEGKTVTLAAEGIAAHRGITLDLAFEEGVLQSPPFDFAWLWAGLIVLVLFGVMALVKLLALRRPVLTTTVGFTAPDEMDPLLMGKLIDGKIDSEDLGALVFWFASNGYLTIDLSEDKDDPKLIRTQKAVPYDMRPYLSDFLAGLFGAGSEVRVSSLRNSFYRTADAVKMQAGAQAGSFYAGKSKAAVGIFAVLSVLLLGGFFWVYGLVTVGHFYVALPPLIFSLIAVAVSVLTSVTASMRAYKWSRAKVWALRLTGLAAGALLALLGLTFYPVSTSCYLVAIMIFVSSVAGMVCGFLLIHTKEYTERLGLVLGFREFILYTEKDKIAVMLEEDPTLYYRILPYAQVLGVTDAWSDKFKGLDVRPPDYIGTGYTAFSILWWNRFSLDLTRSMAHNFVARPSNSGGGVHGGGGFGGGFGGGGFGGGGGRSF